MIDDEGEMPNPDVANAEMDHESIIKLNKRVSEIEADLIVALPQMRVIWRVYQVWAKHLAQGPCDGSQKRQAQIKRVPRKENRLHILVIEDDDGIRDSLEAALEYSDYVYEIITASNGSSALAYLADVEVLPDLIVADLAMPICNGFEFRKAQLADPRLAAIPLVAMSAYHWSPEMRAELKADLYVQKPLDMDMLDEMLEQIYAQTHLKRAGAVPAKIPRTKSRNGNK